VAGSSDTHYGLIGNDNSPQAGLGAAAKSR
jgi:hypothetical protein